MIEKIHNFERSISTEESKVRLEEISKSIEAQENVNFHFYERNKSHVVSVKNSKGFEITYGLGKGVQSEIGAYGECIEHLYYESIGHKDVVNVGAKAFKQTEVCNSDLLLAYSFNLADVPEKIDCISFEEIHSNKERLVPACFIKYHYFDEVLSSSGKLSKSEEFLSRYVTTSGTAFGLTEEDAFLHALNETIERDLTSEFFLEIIPGKHPIKNSFFQLNIDSLPKYLNDYVADIKERHSARTVEIYVSQTIFGPWWSFCIARFRNSSEFLLPQWGAGCSLSYDLSIYRSISECIQMLDNYEEENYEADDRMLLFSRRHSKIANITNLRIEKKFSKVPYQRNANIDELAVKNQINIIVHNMLQRGYKPSKHVVHQTKNFSVVSSYTPNLERFYNVTKRSPVLPMRSIQAYLEKKQIKSRGLV